MLQLSGAAVSELPGPRLARTLTGRPLTRGGGWGEGQCLLANSEDHGFYRVRAR